LSRGVRWFTVINWLSYWLSSTRVLTAQNNVVKSANPTEGGAELNDALQTARHELQAERDVVAQLRGEAGKLASDLAAAAAAGEFTAAELAAVKLLLKQRDGETKALEGMARELEQSLEAERVTCAAVKDELRKLQMLREEEAKDAGSATEQLRALRDNEAKLSARLADRDAQIEKLKVGGVVQVESSRPIAVTRTDGAGIRTPDLLIPAESLVSTLEPMK
jgi:chromosome segregation ATPase